MVDKNKHSNDLSVEELLASLETEDESIATSTNPVIAFIQTFEIKEGKNKIPLPSMYKLFTAWWNKGGFTATKFHVEFSSYFAKHGHGDNYSHFHYKLDNNVNDIIKHTEFYRKSREQNKVKSKFYRRHFENFLNKFNIKAGSLHVEGDVLYHLYDTWCYKNKRIPLTYNSFVSICSLYFDQKYFKNSEIVWYGVDSNIKEHISATAVSNWRQGRQRREKSKNYKVQKEDEQNVIYPDTQTDKEGTS
jgi:hypothetical protein